MPDERRPGGDPTTGSFHDIGAERRLEAIQSVPGLDLTAPPRLVESYSNDTWMLESREHGPAVLRVCWRGDVGRLRREALIGRVLPAAVGYPVVLDGGSIPTAGGDVGWTLTRRLEGTSLLDAWPTLSAGQRQEAGHDLAGRLQALHEWQPPGGLLQELVLIWREEPAGRQCDRRSQHHSPTARATCPPAGTRRAIGTFRRIVAGPNPGGH